MNATLDVKKLTSEMVSFDTVSSKSNMPLVEFLRPVLTGIGFDVEIQTQEPKQDTVTKANIIARAGPRDVEPLMFSAHTDTVPVGTENHWDYEPFKLTEDKRRGLLFGRGSVDMKGSISAMIFSMASPTARGLFIVRAERKSFCSFRNFLSRCSICSLCVLP